MTMIDWTTEIAKRCSHLAGLGKLPPPVAQHSALQALAVLSIAADIDIEHALTPDSTMPILAIPTVTGRHDLADEFLGNLSEAVARPSQGSFHHAFSATNWLDERGLDELVLRSVQHSADDAGRAELLAHAARTAQDLMKQQDRLRHQHMRALLERDAPTLGSEWQHFVPETLAWILAHHYDGDPTRAVRVHRRLQALRLYASLADRLREPAITAIIDEGRELAPALSERLAMSRAQLNALREATPPRALGNYFGNYEQAARHLQAHDVPLHLWPGGGRSGQYAAWHSSPWLTESPSCRIARELTLIRADYYGKDAATVRDTVRSFNDDLLSPLLAGAAAQETGAAPTNCQTFFSSLALTPENLPAIRQFLTTIRHALIGDRGPKAFRRSGATLAPPRRRGRRLAQRKPDRPPRLAASLPALDIALRHFRNRPTHHGEGAGR